MQATSVREVGGLTADAKLNVSDKALAAGGVNGH